MIAPLIHPRCQAKNKFGGRCGVRPTLYRGMYEVCWVHAREYDTQGKLEVYVSRMIPDFETTIITKKPLELTNT